MTLKEIQQKNQYSTDKEFSHHYLGVYDELFAPFKDKKINLLEVGVATGGSLKLWEDYFSKAFIWGIDIKDEISYKYGDRVNWVQNDINKLHELKVDFDIAIDDGSHLVEDQIAFIKLVWPVLNKGGLMIIEDIFDIWHIKENFAEINIPYEIVDLREESGYPDSVLLIFRK
jgi:cysteine synthase